MRKTNGYQKRIISVILSVILIVITIPINVGAVTEASGICGVNLTWELDNDGLLIISGEGKMDNYENYTNGPFDLTKFPEWIQYRDKILSVKIENQVTSIGSYAFQQCKNINSITIPDSIKSIGDGAFYYCTSLSSISIPDSVTSIGYWIIEGTAYYKNEANWNNDELYIGKHLINVKPTKTGIYTIKNGTLTIAGSAFNGCKYITSVTIPDSIKSIGGYAFYNCTSLTSVTIPNSVTSIGNDAFKNCTNCTLYVYEGSYAQNYAIDNSIPYKVISISSINVSTDFKYNYVEGESLDTSNGKLSVNYNNGASEIVDINTDMVSGYDNTMLGMQKLTVTYKN